MNRTLSDALNQFFKSKEDSPTAFMVSLAVLCAGIKEVGKDNCGPEVEMFQSVVSKPLGQSWCLSFIQACIAYAEKAFNVASPLASTELVANLYDTAPIELKGGKAFPGAIAIWRHEDTGEGHCGIVLGLVQTGFYTIEGNTSDGTGIEREGDGVYVRYRPYGGQGKMKEVGFLRPFNP